MPEQGWGAIAPRICEKQYTGVAYHSVTEAPRIENFVLSTFGLKRCIWTYIGDFKPFQSITVQ